jgi:hypothetical protein
LAILPVARSQATQESRGACGLKEVAARFECGHARACGPATRCPAAAAARIDASPCSAIDYPRQGSNASTQVLCVANTLGKSPYRRGAESGALVPESGATDASLAKIMEAWPNLPDAIKTGILALVQATVGSDL